LKCDRERVTGLVDGELPEPDRSVLESHLESCADCRAQAAFERELHSRLRTLPPVELPSDLEERLRGRLRRRPSLRRAWLSMAAALVVVVLWLRGFAPFVAWELARDHGHCFGLPRLPAQVWGEDPGRISAWFQDHGRSIPSLPPGAAGLELTGARFCPLPDGSRVAHVYYSGSTGTASLFIVPHGVRFDTRYAGLTSGRVVRLVRVAGAVVGVVADRSDVADAFCSTLTVTIAEGPHAVGY
jgi:hypothetical protein